MHWRSWSYTALLLALAVVYFGAGHLGLEMADEDQRQVSLVWPPTGIALAALLLFGYRAWPGILLGAFLVNILADEPVATASGIAVGNTLEALCGAWLLGRVVGFRPSLERVRDALGLIALAAIVATTVSATIGVTSLCLGRVQAWKDFTTLWRVWWLGDAMGAMVMAPAILTWTGRSRITWSPSRLAEAVALLVAVALVSLVVFARLWPAVTVDHPLEYVVFPLVIWAALRFGPRGAATATFLISVVAIAGTIQKIGPFSRNSPHEGLVLVQLYMGVVAATSLILGAAIAERQLAERRRAVGHAVARALTESRSLEEAAPRILRSVGEGLDWDAAALWEIDGPAGLLRCVATWHRPDQPTTEFERETQTRTFAAGISLPGRVWSAAAPGWIVDVTQDNNFPRAAAAARAGLHSAFGFPIAAGEEVLGVIEFLSRARRPVDADLLRVMATLGGQIGQFLERQRGEEARARLAALVESSDDAIIGKRLDGIIQSWNAGAERIFGYAVDEVIGKSITLLVPPDRLGEEEGILARLRRGESVEHLETVRVRKDGTQIDVSVTSSPVRDAEGRIIGASKIARDITERKRLERELHDRLEELAEADRRKDDFLAMLGHELRNPLAPVRNGLHILRLDGVDRQTAERTRVMMERQIRHLTRLVDDLLDVSRITRGKVRLRRELLDLTVLVRTTAEDRRATLAAGDVRLEIEVPVEPVFVAGDPTRLAQVLNNLLDNALKFDQGGGPVVVRLELDTTLRQALLVVRDQGIGIGAELLARLFTPFAQGDRDLARSRGGLGLGLAVVKGLVELHGGSVGAASAGPGQGAEFTVRLPLKEEEPALTHAPSPAHVQSGPSLRILVVEDNRDAADSLRMLLEIAGHKVAVAYTGPDGVQRAREWRPDVVLCDIGLPGMDGYEVAGELRQDPATAQVRLIAVTGYGQEEDRQRSRRAGFDQHLVKPIDPESLNQCLIAL